MTKEYYGIYSFFDDEPFTLVRWSLSTTLNLLCTKPTYIPKWKEFIACLLTQRRHIFVEENSIWTPKDINKEQAIKEIALEPYVEMTEQIFKHSEEWTLVRRLIHPMICWYAWNASLCKDQVSKDIRYYMFGFWWINKLEIPLSDGVRTINLKMVNSTHQWVQQYVRNHWDLIS